MLSADQIHVQTKFIFDLQFNGIHADSRWRLVHIKFNKSIKIPFKSAEFTSPMTENFVAGIWSSSQKYNGIHKNFICLHLNPTIQHEKSHEISI